MILLEEMTAPCIGVIVLKQMFDFARLPLGRGPLLVAAVALAMPAVAQTPELALLGQLERGAWQLVERGSTRAPRAVCLGDARLLLQLQHPLATCSRFIVSDTAQSVTVSYDCGAAGNGRTTIRRETNRLVQIETQGIARGSPFSMTLEARRTGTCE